MCVLFWSKTNEGPVVVDYVQELLSYENSKYVSAVLSGFATNLGREQEWLHIVHRRSVEMQDLTRDWLDPQESVTRLFSELYEGVISPSDGVLSIESTRMQNASPCGRALAEDLPREAKPLLGATLATDFPSPPEGKESLVPYSSYRFGPLPPEEGTTWAFRLGFRIQDSTYEELVATTKHDRRHEIQGAKIVLKDIEIFDFGAIPRENRQEFEAYESKYAQIVDHMIPASVYDVVARECSKGTKVVRFDALVRKLPVPAGIDDSDALQWWRSEDDGFLIQLVEPKR